MKLGSLDHCPLGFFRSFPRAEKRGTSCLRWRRWLRCCCSGRKTRAGKGDSDLSRCSDKNRLNVATSRAKCVCILVGSPRVFEAECRTPRQMQLANAFCRYLEMATLL